jgi:hypothetical protein
MNGRQASRFEPAYTGMCTLISKIINERCLWSMLEGFYDYDQSPVAFAVITLSLLYIPRQDLDPFHTDLLATEHSRSSILSV